MDVRVLIMIRKGIEKGLIEYCAPTLAGIKCASLFNYFHEGEQIAQKELDEINKLLNKKGVNVEILIWKEKSALLYVYRTAMLENELKQPGVFELLESYGYESCDINICLKNLKKCIFKCFMRAESFHE